MQTSFTQSISPSWTTNFYSYKPTAMLLILLLDKFEVHVYKWYLGLTWFPVYIWSYFWIVISSFVIGGNRKCYRWLICPNCSTQHNKSTLEASCSIRTKKQIQIVTNTTTKTCKKWTFLQKLHKLRLCLYFSFVGSFGLFYSFAAFPVIVGFFLAHIVNW